jgi:hypothetical protein
VFSGMLVASTIGIILIPMHYAVIQRFREWATGAFMARAAPTRWPRIKNSRRATPCGNTGSPHGTKTDRNTAYRELVVPTFSFAIPPTAPRPFAVPGPLLTRRTRWSAIMAILAIHIVPALFVTHAGVVGHVYSRRAAYGRDPDLSCCCDGCSNAESEKSPGEE